MKERGLLLFVMGVLLIASDKRFIFKDDVIPSYHHTVFDKDRIRQKLLRLEKKIAFGPISKRDEDEDHWMMIKPKRDLKYSIRVKILTLKYSLKPMPNYRTHEEWTAYIRKITMNILNKYYNMEESDFFVSPEGRVKMVGEKKVVAADWVYKKYGILKPRPTFIRTRDEFGVEMYVIECPPEWVEDVIIAPIDFSEIEVELKVPWYMKMAEPILDTVLAGSILALSFFISHFISPEAVLSVVSIGLAKVSPLSGNIRYDQLTKILNVTDYGIYGDGVVNETDELETLFTDHASEVLFFPRGTYDVGQWGTRVLGTYDDVIGPAVLASTTIVGEGEGTEFVALADALYMLYLNGNNITIQDVKFTGTGAAGAGNLSSGAIYTSNIDNLHLIRVTSNDMIGGGGSNSRGLSIVGTQVGSLIQDCRMDGNQFGLILEDPNPPDGVRIISCRSNDATETNYYFEGEALGTAMLSCVADGTGVGCHTVYVTTQKGTTITGNSFISDGNGIEPYQAGAYTAYGMTWGSNVCQSGAVGIYPQCSHSIFISNVATFSATEGFYSIDNFDYNIVVSNTMSLNTNEGLRLNGASDNNDYMYNQIIDNSGAQGLRITDGDNNRFTGDKVYSSATGSYHTTYGLWIEGGSNTILQDIDLRSAGATIYQDDTTTTKWVGIGNLTGALA